MTVLVLLVILIAFLVVVAIVLSVVVYYMRKGIRFVKRVANGEAAKDYFKHQGNSRKQQRGQRQTNRTTRTADGLTIVDNRSPEKANKKIFAQDEGEYVDFTEE